MGKKQRDPATRKKVDLAKELCILEGGYSGSGKSENGAHGKKEVLSTSFAEASTNGSLDFEGGVLRAAPNSPSMSRTLGDVDTDSDGVSALDDLAKTHTPIEVTAKEQAQLVDNAEEAEILPGQLSSVLDVLPDLTAIKEKNTQKQTGNGIVSPLILDDVNVEKQGQMEEIEAEAPFILVDKNKKRLGKQKFKSLDSLQQPFNAQAVTSSLPSSDRTLPKKIHTSADKSPYLVIHCGNEFTPVQSGPECEPQLILIFNAQTQELNSSHCSFSPRNEMADIIEMNHSDRDEMADIITDGVTSLVK
ncbi:Uncharacterized protein Fot_24327 [Forsythia ovata]|uniref:Uncharacterized protein n=1 Tax=Forsythia ovata TaxID=205694 RepID=A0ABD1U5Y2_9LAMI